MKGAWSSCTRTATITPASPLPPLRSLCTIQFLTKQQTLTQLYPPAASITPHHSLATALKKLKLRHSEYESSVTSGCRTVIPDEPKLTQMPKIKHYQRKWAREEIEAPANFCHSHDAYVALNPNDQQHNHNLSHVRTSLPAQLPLLAAELPAQLSRPLDVVVCLLPKHAPLPACLKSPHLKCRRHVY